MTKTIVIGAKYTFKPPTQDYTDTEHVFVGDGSREHLDRLVNSMPENVRRTIATFLAPLLEGKEPARDGIYESRVGGLVVWWKHAEVV